MPIGYYNYVIGGRLNTREKKRQKKSLFSVDFSDRDNACWDDEKTSRQSLLWIWIQQADAAFLPFVV
jgi:hypothetical protein